MHWWNLFGEKFNHIFYSQMWNWNENYWRELELKGARRSNMITKSCCTLKGAAHRVKAFYLNKMVVQLLNLSWKPGDQNGGRGSLTDVLGTPRHQSDFWSKVQIFTKLFLDTFHFLLFLDTLFSLISRPFLFSPISRHFFTCSNLTHGGPWMTSV